MKKIAFLLLLSPIFLIAQKKKSSKMGQTTLEELKMTVYDKDSTATAVVLYEHANRYPDNINNQKPRTDYYYRIKILDQSSFNLASIQIYLFNDEKIKDLKAITYNLEENGTINKSPLLKKDIFSIKEGKNWVVKKFTMPNIKVGSIIEYKYSISSPYLKIDDWYFQSDIPKIRSEFDASILGNYNYNIKMVGYLNLDKNDSSINKRCVYVNGNRGDCLVYSFAMDNIPAFKVEDYMLSKKNYISKITFDLKSRRSYDGKLLDHTTTWKQADKNLKKQFFNNQISKKSFFKKNIPDSILNLDNTLEKAKKIFQFIQKHYTWNERYWTNRVSNVKESFQNKSGNVSDINISLYNSLKAANINTNVVVLSTRNNGIPTKLFPVIYNYNYVIVSAEIDGKTYFLDATNKYLPFNQLPVRTLNGEARVLNFEGDSKWVTLKPSIKTSKNISTKLILDEEGVFSGNLMIRNNGYFASDTRENISLLGEDGYLEKFENDFTDLEIEDYKSKNLIELDKPLQEVFKIRIEMDEDLGNKIRINPFLFERVTKNPFKLKERNYPVDFAYSRKINYFLSLKVPENYNIINQPKDKAFSLPNNGGNFILKTVKKGNVINFYVKLNILKSFYKVEEYYALKEFFKQIIISEKEDLILEKKK